MAEIAIPTTIREGVPLADCGEELLALPPESDSRTHYPDAPSAASPV